MVDTSEELLKRAGNGDKRAFEELFAHHRDYLHLAVRLRMDRQMASRVDVSDVIQDAHLEAFRRMDDFLQRRPMPFRIWLRKTAHETLLRLRRKHVGAAMRTVTAEVPLPERSSVALARQLIADTATPSAEMAKAELIHGVQAAIARLPELDREILLLRNYEALTNQEAAQVLEIEADTARKRYARALLRLRDGLEAAGGGEG